LLHASGEREFGFNFPLAFLEERVRVAKLLFDALLCADVGYGN